MAVLVWIDDQDRLGQVALDRGQLREIRKTEPVNKEKTIRHSLRNETVGVTDKIFQLRSNWTPIWARLSSRFLHWRVTSRPVSEFKMVACSYSRCSRLLCSVQHHMMRPGRKRNGNLTKKTR